MPTRPTRSSTLRRALAAAVQAGGTMSQIDPGFTISGLSGCGLLDGFLSAVAAGGGNRATVQFTPPAVG